MFKSRFCFCTQCFHTGSQSLASLFSSFFSPVIMCQPIILCGTNVAPSASSGPVTLHQTKDEETWNYTVTEVTLNKVASIPSVPASLRDLPTGKWSRSIILCCLQSRQATETVVLPSQNRRVIGLLLHALHVITLQPENQLLPAVPFLFPSGIWMTCACLVLL